MGAPRYLPRFMAGLSAWVGACALTYAGATWNAQPYTVTLPAINSVGQATEGSVTLPLAHDTPCTIAVSIPVPGDELLTHAGQTLVTSYRLSGAAISNADPDFISSTDFLARTYVLPGSGPLDSLTLQVRGAAPPTGAIDAGNYSATIILTVSW